MVVVCYKTAAIFFALYAGLQNNLYHNLSVAYGGLKDIKKSWKFAEEAKNIRERYRLPFNQNAIAQIIHHALLLTAREKPQKAVAVLKALERAYENEPFFDTTMAEIYKGLGASMNHISHLKAGEYFKKARTSY